MSSPEQEGAPPGAPFVPQGNVPYVNVPNTADYPRLVASLPYFAPVAIAEIIQPSVLEAVESVLPGLIPPYIQPAVDSSIAAQCVLLVGSTMSGALNLPGMPTQPNMAADKAYVDSMVATVVPEVPPVPSGQSWMRETGMWVPAVGGGTVSQINTGAGLSGGPITGIGTISMANMAANSLKGNNTGAVASPTDIPAGTVLTMIGGAPLNSPVFTGSPSLPTGTAAITQPGGTNNTTVATTAFVANSLNSYAPIASPVFTGAPNMPTGTIGVTQTAGTSNTSLATTAFVAGAITTATGNYLPLTGGRLSGGLASGPAAQTVPGLGALTLNANTVAPLVAPTAQLSVIGANNGIAGANAGIECDAYGTGNANIYARRARGTAAAPTAVQNGDYLASFGGFGYGASAFGTFNAMSYQAVENWTATAQGTLLSISTTPPGTNTTVNSLVLAGNTATFSGDVLFSGGGAGTAHITGGTAYLVWTVPITNNTGYCGSPTDAWAQVNAYALNNLSDPRDKRDMAPAPAGALDKVAALPVITYRHKDDNSDAPLRTGFDATEVHRVHPDAVVRHEEDNSPRGYSLSDMNALLWQAVQELSAKVAALEGRV